MSHAETLEPEVEIACLKAERDHLRKELERFYAMDEAVQNLKAAYSANASAASRSNALRAAIMKVVGL